MHIVYIYLSHFSSFGFIPPPGAVTTFCMPTYMQEKNALADLLFGIDNLSSK